MKNFCIIFLSLIIISLTAVGFSGVLSKGGENLSSAYTEYLRIHIRADSNEQAAQAVKYKVRDEVVSYLTPLVAGYETQEEAVRGIAQNLYGVRAAAEKILQQEGFHYGAEAELTVENFPTRVYGEYTLPAGEYTALIVRLGRGEGDNWWCVVYPPLCFAATDTDVVYRSKIKEIIERFYN